ncbi:MAG TPA: hypothetical protein PKA13_10725 [Geminicoccaceae bacterium]|mgnify:CR=1 FL=1|nr:hypothetical protein [Geminicoccus sp.]HMU50239.1 hypothetical protein [Geminicoccaceae bacterium]
MTVTIDNDLAVRADVSPSLHPDALAHLGEALDREGTIGRAAYHDARDALGTVYRTLGAIADAEAALQAHTNAASPARRHQLADGRSAYLGNLRLQDGRVRSFGSPDEEFAEAAGEALHRATQAIDRRLGTLQRHHEALQTRVAEALRPSEPVPVQQEVRAYVRSLRDNKRLEFLTTAAKAGDRQTIGSVLAGPLYLSGINQGNADLVRSTAARAIVPLDWEQMNSVGRAIEAVQTAGARLVTKIGELEQYRKGTAARVSKAVDGIRKVGAAHAA